MRLTYQAFYIVLKSPVCICCSQFFISGRFSFSFVLGYGNLCDEEKEKEKLPEIKKLTTAYTKQMKRTFMKMNFLLTITLSYFLRNEWWLSEYKDREL